jgi:hypothetical protein
MTAYCCPLCRVPYGNGPCRACEVARGLKARPLVQDDGPVNWRLVGEIQDKAATREQERDMFARLRQRLDGIAAWTPYRPEGAAIAPGDAEEDGPC